MMSVEEMKKKRFQFLHSLYEVTEGNEQKIVNMRKLGQELRFQSSLTQSIVQYLQGEGLIETIGHGGTIRITHLGVREVEEALSNPDKQTDHFLPFNTVNIVSVEKMIDSQIQQAGSRSTQAITISEERHEELKEIIQLLKDSIDQLDLSSLQLSDLQAEIHTIEAQMLSSKPKDKIITECFKSIRSILEGAAGSALASNLLSRILSLLGE